MILGSNFAVVSCKKTLLAAETPFISDGGTKVHCRGDWKRICLGWRFRREARQRSGGDGGAGDGDETQGGGG